MGGLCSISISPSWANVAMLSGARKDTKRSVTKSISQQKRVENKPSLNMRGKFQRETSGSVIKPKNNGYKRYTSPRSLPRASPYKLRVRKKNSSITVGDLILNDGGEVDRKRVIDLTVPQLRKLGHEMLLRLPNNIKKKGLRKLIISGLKSWKGDGTRSCDRPSISRTSTRRIQGVRKV